MTRISRFVSAAAIATALSLTPVFAQDPAPAPQDHARLDRGMRGKHGMHGRFGEAIGLTDAQKQQIEEIHKTDGEQMRTLHQQLAEKRRALESSLAADQIDRTSVETLVQEIGALQTDMLRKQTDLRIKVMQVLTPEQRQKMSEMHGKRGFGRGFKRGGIN
jgi:protein CpxP